MKYNRIRRIVRARNGSQIPKFQNAGILNMTQNPYMAPNSMAVQKPSAIDVANATALPVDFSGLPSKFKQTMQKFGQKAGQFMNNNQNMISQGADMLGNFMNSKVENSENAEKGYMAADMATNILGKINPALGMYSKIGLAGFKMINSTFGKKTQDFSADTNMLAQIGGSYGDSSKEILDASANAGKKYGLFSNRARRKANRAINDAREQQDIMTGIANEAMDQRNAIRDINYLAYQNDINGGWEYNHMRVAKSGMKLSDKIDLVKKRRTTNNFINVDTKEIEWEPIIEFKNGGTIESEWEPIIDDIADYWEPVIIDIEYYQEGGKLEKSSFENWFTSIPEEYKANQYDYKKAYEVFDWETLSKHAKDPVNNHLYSVSPIADENGNYPFLKLGKIEDNPEIQGEFDWYNSEEGKEHKSKFDIEYINDRYYYVPKKFKDGGKTKEELETPKIEETTQKNLIPEGALHKNKHHMEHTEGLTQKGIPVVDNDGEQQAEIELNEIIFTLEVTKKLEELYKEGTDEAAIEAGKLLVKEILFNTDDRTNLISKCEKGGKLNESV